MAAADGRRALRRQTFGLWALLRRASRTMHATAPSTRGGESWAAERGARAQGRGERSAEREACNGDGRWHVEPERQQREPSSDHDDNRHRPERQLPQRADRQPAEHRADAEQHQ